MEEESQKTSLINRKMYIVSGVLIGFILLLMLTISIVRIQKEQKITIRPTPLPSATPIVEKEKPVSKIPTPTPPNVLNIIEIFPENNAQDVPLDTKILITLNRKFSKKDITFSINPAVKFSIIAKNTDTAEISFTAPLRPATTYTYLIGTSTAIPQQHSFTTTSVNAVEKQ